MRYKVTGTMEFNVSMDVYGESIEDAENKAMDRMDEGALDGFTLGETTNNNEVCEITEVQN